MFRHRSLIATSVALSLLIVGTAPATAQSAVYYRATVSNGPAPQGVISSGMAWQAHENELRGAESGDQPWMVCAELAHEVGAISGFSAEGKALAQDKLDYCNKSARKSR